MLSSLVVCLCFGLRHLTFLTKSSETQYLEFISRLCSQLLTYQDLGGGVQLLLVFRYSHFHSLYLKYFQDKSNENNSTIEQFSIPLHDCMLTILSNLVLDNWDSLLNEVFSNMNLGGLLKDHTLADNWMELLFQT